MIRKNEQEGAGQATAVSMAMPSGEESDSDLSSRLPKWTWGTESRPAWINSNFGVL